MDEPTRRWDVDERGRGIASGEPFAAGVDELRAHMREPDWISEDAREHLLHHIRGACGETLRVVADDQLDDGVYEVTLVWDGARSIGAIRSAVFALVGSFAESSTHVRQRTADGAVEFDVVTGMLPDETHFRTHGHLVRFRIEGLADDVV